MVFKSSLYSSSILSRSRPVSLLRRISRDCLGLDLAEVEFLHQGFGDLLCAEDAVRLITSSDDPGAIRSPSKTWRFCFPAGRIGSPGDNFFLVIQVVDQHLLQVQNSRLVVHQGKHDGSEGFLHLSVFVELFEDDLSVSVPLQLDYNPHPGSVRFVPQIGNPVDLLLPHQICDPLEEGSFVDHIGDFCHYDPGSAV